MIVKVEKCWAGQEVYRLTLPDGSRERINRDTWNRQAASEALDLLEHVYHLERRKIRFQ